MQNTLCLSLICKDSDDWTFITMYFEEREQDVLSLKKQHMQPNKTLCSIEKRK